MSREITHGRVPSESVTPLARRIAIYSILTHARMPVLDEIHSEPAGWSPSSWRFYAAGYLSSALKKLGGSSHSRGVPLSRNPPEGSQYIIRRKLTLPPFATQRVSLSELFEIVD